MKVSIIFILSCVMCLYAMGQQLPLTNFGVKDGMTSDYVTGIVHDKDGFMYVSTQYGINRYDGNVFANYLKDANNTISCNNDISCLLADTISGKVLIGHRLHGLNVYDCKTLRMLKYDTASGCGLSSDEIFGIAQRRSGDILVINKAGIDKFYPEDRRFEQVCDFKALGLPDDAIMAVACGPDGDVYLGYANSGVAVLDASLKACNIYSADSGSGMGPNSNNIHSLFVENGNTLWIGTGKGISQMDLHRRIFKDFSGVEGLPASLKGQINSIYKSKTGMFWIGTTSELCYFDSNLLPRIMAGKGGVARMFIRDFHYGISNPTVNVITEDHFGNIWIGSNGGGVSLVDDKPRIFGSWRINKILGVTNGLNDKEVMTMAIDRDGNIWMGTDGGGININRDGCNGEAYTPGNGRASALSYVCSLIDSNGRIWMGATGLGHFDIFDADHRLVDTCALLDGEQWMNCIYEDNDRVVWIGTASGVERYDLKNGNRDKLHLKDFAGSDNISAIYQDKRGQMWIGLYNGGIAVYDGRDNFARVEGLPKDGTVNQFYNDSKGWLWIAMDEGLGLVSDPGAMSGSIFTANDGLACDRICSLTEDNAGGLWMSTNVGLSYYNEAECKFTNIGTETGALQGSYFPNSVVKSHDGIVYFGGLHGVCFFNPQQVFACKELPPVVFTECKVHGSGLDHSDSIMSIVDGKVRLNPGQNIFSVSFNVMDKSVQGQVEYAYRCEGLGSQWINIGSENNVVFRNIPPGKYRLCVKARYRHLDWPEEYSALEIEALAPLWRRPYMLALYAILVILAFCWRLNAYKRNLALKSQLAIEKANVQRTMELNEEKLKFFTNITHELRTPLSLILGPIADLENCVEKGTSQHKKVSFIHDNALRLLSLVTKILEFRKVETNNKRLKVAKGDVAVCVKDASSKFKSIADKQGIDFIVEMPAEKRTMYFDEESLVIIVDNLLSNALKYTEKGHVRLAVDYVNDNGVEYAEITVEDTGVGISKEDIDHIFDRYYRSADSNKAQGFGLGLALVKKLVELHEGQLAVESEPQLGSSFKVRLLVHNDYPNAEHRLVYEQEAKSTLAGKPIILVVDDEKDMRDYIADEFKDSYEVLLAANGREGLELVEKSLPDLVISDVMMPGMSGVDLCRAIKGNPTTAHIPVMLLSALDANNDKIDGYNAGADSYVTKPFSSALLKSRISNILEDRRKIVDVIANNPQMRHKIISESISKEESVFIDRFMDIVVSKIEDDKIDVPMLASEMSMSYSSLYRKVKGITGMSPIELIRKIRLHKAEGLLLSAKYSVSQICMMVGFSSQSYFRESFKAEFGLSPTEYVRNIK